MICAEYWITVIIHSIQIVWCDVSWNWIWSFKRRILKFGMWLKHLQIGEKFPSNSNFPFSSLWSEKSMLPSSCIYNAIVSFALCSFLFHVRSVILMVWLAQWPKIMLSLCWFSISCFDDGLVALAENMFKINLSMVAKFRRMEDTNPSWFNISFLESIISVWTELCREFKWFNFRIWTELNFERQSNKK